MGRTKELFENIRLQDQTSDEFFYKKILYDTLYETYVEDCDNRVLV